ncbi:hypothetical protein AAP_05680 [Ascosphaera apis ARSEF 7405]|uniref:Uncharacterized protein n=1 Tax=Ascosphaera apis ARSEF 7405 TaxID=392613 RepID=A0A167VFB6_9EURO|nr:hypothetical protein AAP_05680 [Ascosphaera apis ARSEF 7405]
MAEQASSRPRQFSESSEASTSTNNSNAVESQSFNPFANPAQTTWQPKIRRMSWCPEDLKRERQRSLHEISAQNVQGFSENQEKSRRQSEF